MLWLRAVYLSLTVFSIFTVYWLIYALNDVGEKTCEMTYMYPNYIKVEWDKAVVSKLTLLNGLLKTHI